ncbi:hypothetical protein D3C81_2142660 [compost metagenome]
MTPFTSSTLLCTIRNNAEDLRITHVRTTISSGSVTASKSPSLTCTTSAMITLPSTTSGTRVMKRSAINTVSCSCVTSPVSRVISEEV